MMVQARETEIGVGLPSSDIPSKVLRDNPSADGFQGISTRLMLI
ncbi:MULTISPECIES: hypothetical protein [Paenibacillus]|jgi:hypothetical protein|nr:hypothetical protein [Paenibacillus barengoltzii]